MAAAQGVEETVGPVGGLRDEVGLVLGLDVDDALMMPGSRFQYLSGTNFLPLSDAWSS